VNIVFGKLGHLRKTFLFLPLSSFQEFTSGEPLPVFWDDIGKKLSDKQTSPNRQAEQTFDDQLIA
jgi:hypothetical protein